MNKAAIKTRGAVIVTRVSGQEQAREGTSLESQLDACRAKALAVSLPIVAEYEDAAVSGAFLLARPGMQAAIGDIQAGRADTLICPNMSRYSRDVEHQQTIKKAVRAAGGRLVFCDMDFDDTPEGDLAFNIMGGFAEYERQVIRERTMKGRRKRASQGVQTARGWSPYGYTIPKTKDVIAGRFPAEAIGQYLIHEEEAAVVRWLFAEYAAGNDSLPGLARQLNARGVPTKMGAALWHPPTIRGFFVNTAYIGRPKFGKLTCHKDERRLSEIRPSTGEPFRTPDVRRPTAPENVIELSAPPLVDQATWDAVQARLTTNKARRGGNPCRTHMLSGTVVCERCGAAMQMNGGNPKKGYAAHYTCGRHRETNAYTGERVCSNEHFKVPVAEEAVVKSIESALTERDIIAIALRAYREQSNALPANDLRRELAAADTALGELAEEDLLTVQAQMAGMKMGASPAAYAAVFADLAARRKDLEDRRGALRRMFDARRPAGTDPGGGAELKAKALADVGRVLRSDKVPAMVKRRAVMTVVEKVYCRRDGAVVTFLPGPFGGETSQEDTLQDLKCSFF